eukprot:13681518-Alexandrium_andersonii.AAC.1
MPSAIGTWCGGAVPNRLRCGKAPWPSERVRRVHPCRCGSHATRMLPPSSLAAGAGCSAISEEE